MSCLQIGASVLTRFQEVVNIGRGLAKFFWDTTTEVF